MLSKAGEKAGKCLVRKGRDKGRDNSRNAPFRRVENSVAILRRCLPKTGLPYSQARSTYACFPERPALPFISQCGMAPASNRWVVNVACSVRRASESQHRLGWNGCQPAYEAAAQLTPTAPPMPTSCRTW